jgi:hypothetical protein
MRADQGRPDILDLFQEDAEVYFPKFGFGRNSFLEMVKGFEGALEYIQHDYKFDFYVIPGKDRPRPEKFAIPEGSIWYSQCGSERRSNG